MRKISWGVLSTAKIGTEKVIPAMQKGSYSAITAIASRNVEKAQSAARRLGIPKAYGSYEELLSDRDLDAIYIPLPNHLHVEWTIRALQAGKHVLCEKPIGMNLPEALQLQREAQNCPQLKVMEAFMYRHHPQWATAKKMIESGEIGELKNVHALFTYYNVDPQNIRNQADLGGGGLLDIGCYCISVSRHLFGSEPARVCGVIDYDPKMEIDRLASGVMEFEKGTATFTCSTQLAHQQRVSVFGTLGKIEIEKPFTPGPLESCKLVRQTVSETKEITVEACDQYTQQSDLFSQAVLNETNVPTPFADAVANMRVIEAVLASHQRRAWVEI